ncbi:HemK2/MTQ2 family protein methyltransferase [Streptomyces sp. NPDC051322]|uniref:HemK2/MTQ2 family protein methyltransferase n=1 Tax=Streptomyces sp. NPDC051322 TaxID=3154645 RepID=UPI00344B7F6F
MSTETAALSGPGRLLTLPGVYAPQHDTRILLAAMGREEIGPGMDVLDLGTGSGALAVRAARRGARVTAVDIAWRAVVTTRLNALLSRQRIRVRRGDLTASLTSHAYDLVICNPPYVPGPASRLPVRGAARAWDAGNDGRAVIDRVCGAAPSVVRPGGVLLMVHSSLCDPALTVRRLSYGGLKAEISDRAFVPIGPVLRSRRAWLHEQGLLAADEHKEELVVIRAERL